MKPEDQDKPLPQKTANPNAVALAANVSCESFDERNVLVLKWILMSS